MLLKKVSLFVEILDFWYDVALLQKTWHTVLDINFLAFNLKLSDITQIALKAENKVLEF